MKVFFGIDIGGTQLKIGAFSENETLLQKWTVITDLSDAGKRIIPQVGDEIRKWISVRSLTTSDIGGIGMGIPGPVTKDGYVRTCVNLNWNNFYPEKELQRQFPNIAVAVGNDANVAALGEYTHGAGKQYASAMLITIGTGIGGGVILDGEIISGAHGIAGEIGHITTDAEAEESCNCGNIGCVDHIASATGIVRKMKKLWEESEENSVLRGGVLTAQEICRRAEEGDLLCIRCIDLCMAPLGKAMAFFSHAFDPEVFMIGGGVSRAGDVILTPLKKHYKENLYLIQNGADIRAAELGNDAGMIGSCMLVMERTAKRKRYRR